MKHRRRAAHDDDRLAQILDAGGAAERADGPLHRTLAHEAARGIDVRRSDRVQHLVERHAARRHALRIELHLELAQVSAEAFDRRHAGHGEQPVAHVELREIAQRHQVRRARLRLERELEDLVESTGHAGQQRRLGARRELRGHLRDPLGDELARAVVVGVGLELDRHLDRRRAETATGCGECPAVRPSAASSGMAMPVSSSSAPMAAFCTMTLNTGADRSGKTSRRRRESHRPPTPHAMPSQQQR